LYINLFFQQVTDDEQTILTSDENSSSVVNEGSTLLPSTIVPAITGPALSKKSRKALHDRNAKQQQQQQLQQEEGQTDEYQLETQQLLKPEAAKKQPNIIGQYENGAMPQITTTATAPAGVPFWMAHERKSKRVAVSKSAII
jgi:hypothetical protein